ncbi:hypothetical protein CYMTET_13971 [Cymbomonas tetramitiformis]|uniref:Glycosyltransferase 2-like domain-containing protein n=1 Tax=Cymbomonas tetramitiformis TaxID=36881 RepID=A0AAE0LAV0_9CHLO|nr:hypothetical protein CYMTET_13971 [Cymbomonas tetramitiformis]
MFKKLLPFFIAFHLIASFSFFIFFMPGDNVGKYVTSGPEQQKIEELQRELQATRDMLHQQHSEHDLNTILGVNLDAQEPPSLKKKPLSYNFPISGAELEIKETQSMIQEPEGGYSSKPFFSIVLAAYNQGKFLQETMRSIIAQTYDRWEVILVNDGSTDDTWDTAESLVERHKHQRIRIISKRNGGLADARNVGLRHANGNWLCMLDSDDLLGRDYLQRAADFVIEDDEVDIVPGCMRNFDAVSNEWCFPEGFSIVGIAHWNKFHASVLMSRRLMEKIGGYDPGIPWGLEDWNYWLSTAPHNPTVRFIPETTFYYRHHAGTSMRKKMFAKYLELTKAMVRTNHAKLYEPVQLLHDHDTIMNADADTLEKLEEKINKYPTLPMPYFWRALFYMKQMQQQKALSDFTHALQFAKNVGQVWQANYWLALLHESMGSMIEAEQAINVAFKHAYFDEILHTKYRIEGELKMAASGTRPMVLAGHVTTTPSYWVSTKEQADIRAGTLAGKLLTLEKLDKSMSATVDVQHRMMALMRTATDSPCPAFSGARAGVQASPINKLENGGFESDSASWYTYGKGFAMDSPPPRSGTLSELSVVMMNDVDTEMSGIMQVVTLRQETASPVFVTAWSRANSVQGAPDDGYSLYIDINFQDDTHEWGYVLPFDTGTHGWQRRSAYLDKGKPIISLDVYCMFRYHIGKVWFDDVTVALTSDTTCQCRLNEIYDPAPNRECSPCPEGKVCVLGDALDPID